MCVTKEFLRHQIEEREQQKREEKARSLREDLALEQHLQQQQHVQMPAAQQHPQPAQSKPSSHNTWTASAVNQPSAQPQPPGVSTACALR